MQLSQIIVGLKNHASVRRVQVALMLLGGSQAALKVADLVEATGIITKLVLEPIGHVGGRRIAFQGREGGLR
jgi:hypothetical protein